MNLSKLSSSEKLAVYGAVATVIGATVAASTWPGHWGVTWLGAILGVAMLAIVFLPQVSPTTKLPGKSASLMVAVGGAAALLMAFVLLTTFAFTFQGFDPASLLFLIAVAGAIVMGWAGWQAFQADGGKFDIGISGAAAAPPVPMVPPPAAPPPSPGMPSSETSPSGDDDRP
ncbi:MAG TPA: hypothetical protein VL687_07975 [Methylomirabilota bacterium]|jgi:hypothetical protein|nr:hypothetical protein [Methylomirabilota bacterium]